ncbi:hypothetical protein GCM10010353_66550 [Streptomyces chryseus]|nr:hypothetical protein GCM10010353_66550 [Streptomyces chryseus]
MLSPSRIRSLPAASPVKCRLLALLLSALLLIVLDCTLLLHEPGQSQGSPSHMAGLLAQQFHGSPSVTALCRRRR